MYRLFNLIALRVMINEYIHRMNHMKHASRFSTQSLIELEKQFTICTERNQP